MASELQKVRMRVSSEAVLPAPAVTAPREAEESRAPAKTAYRMRGFLAAVPIVVALLAPPMRAPRIDPFWVGVLLVIAGWGVRIWAQAHLGYRLRRRMTLVTCGPFRFCRNPIYLGNAAVVVGTVAATSPPWSWVLLAAAWCAIVFPAVVLVEEHRLQRVYGRAYRRYRLATPAWWPRLPAVTGRCGHSVPSEALVAEAHVPLVLLPVLVRSLLIG